MTIEIPENHRIQVFFDIPYTVPAGRQVKVALDIPQEERAEKWGITIETLKAEGIEF
ncbi:hypothetical protein FACS189447_10000 [Spirochaetia bacterium]|nr:hypothetical protein FACS189447_10000 [Spirochaetia bacterium]